MTSITQPGKQRRRMPAPQRREAILAAALDVFSEAGFHQASLDRVAERAGISKALIYEHFGSKRELQRALLETYGGELLARVVEAIVAAEPGEERLRAGAESFLSFVEQRREAWRLLVRNPADPDVTAAVSRLQEEAAAAIGGLMIEEAPRARQAEHAAGELDVEMLSQQLVGALRALANWWDDHRDVPRERVLAMAMEFAWLGFERVTSGERWQPASP